MIVNADIAAIKMIENKGLFLDLIDHMDKVGEGEEVRIALYQHLLLELLERIWPAHKKRPAKDVPAERNKLEAALSIDNLERVGLLIHVDRARGVMVFAPFIIEMFRHFDGARLRKLNSADYEVIRASFNRLYEVFIGRQFTGEHDLDFKEQVEALRKEVRRALSQMKECVSALQSRLDHLGEIVERMHHDNLDEVSAAREALSEINSIYLRNILPALEFLAENLDLKDGQPALRALAMTASHLERQGYRPLASSIYYQIEAIRSYRHDIEVIRGSLTRYVQQSEAQRLAYDRIEQAWNLLHGAVQSLHDGTLRGNQLAGGHPIFAHWPTFKGLKVWRFDQKVEWPKENHRLRLTEHLRTELPKVRIPLAEPQIVKPRARAHQAGQREADERLFHISRLMADWAAHPCDDLHDALNSYLGKHLPAYSLNDLLAGMNCLKSKEGIALIPRFEIATLAGDRQRLRYYKLRLEVAHA